MRLFATVHPPPAVLDHLETALEAVRPGDHDDARGPLRWTPPADRHVTVAFYGEVPDGLVPELADDLAAVAAAHGPFDLALRGAGVFDHRTLWVGCADPDGGLAALVRDAVAVGRDLLGRTDDRTRSRAHLTVARVRPGAGRPRRGRAGTGRAPAADPAAALAHALAVYAGPSWRVDRLALVGSTLGAGPGGSPRHDVVAEPLLGPVAG